VGQNAYDISIRETLQKNRKTGLTVAIIFIIVSVGLAIHLFWANRTAKIDSYSAFYSDDDGQTYFKDTVLRLPPFEHNGKIADLAIVCTDGKRDFVAYLQRYTPDAKTRLQQVYNANPSAPYKVIDMMASPQIAIDGTEIKLPGKNNLWSSRSKTRVPDIQSPSGGDIEVVHP
jgi:hypothetical protein